MNTRTAGPLGRYRHVARLAVIIWALVIFGFSSLHGSDIPGNYSVLGHFILYFILGGLLLLALGRPSRAALAAAVMLASAYGITDEFHQSFVPGRCPDPADWAVDTGSAIIGAAVAVLLLLFIREHNRRVSA